MSLSEKEQVIREGLRVRMREEQAKEIIPESLVPHNIRQLTPEIGQKYDSGKQKWHALPLCILEPLADVLQAGVKKYAKFNCLQSFENSDERFYNGTMRHLEACQFDPLAIDEETGCYHAAQVAFNTLMRLYHAQKEKKACLKPSD